MANVKGINHLRKAFRAPEDHFHSGTIFRVARTDDEDRQLVETVFVKVSPDEWVALVTSESQVIAEACEFADVVRVIADHSGVAEIAHSWRPVNPEN